MTKMTIAEFEDGLRSLLQYAEDPEDCWIQTQDKKGNYMGDLDTLLVFTGQPTPNTLHLRFANGQEFMVSFTEIEEGGTN